MRASLRVNRPLSEKEYSFLRFSLLNLQLTGGEVHGSEGSLPVHEQGAVRVVTPGAFGPGVGHGVCALKDDQAARDDEAGGGHRSFNRAVLSIFGSLPLAPGKQPKKEKNNISGALERLFFVCVCFFSLQALQAAAVRNTRERKSRRAELTGAFFLPAPTTVTEPRASDAKANACVTRTPAHAVANPLRPFGRAPGFSGLNATAKRVVNGCGARKSLNGLDRRIPPVTRYIFGSRRWTILADRRFPPAYLNSHGQYDASVAPQGFQNPRPVSFSKTSPLCGLTRSGQQSDQLLASVECLLKSFISAKFAGRRRPSSPAPSPGAPMVARGGMVPMVASRHRGMVCHGGMVQVSGGPLRATLLICRFAVSRVGRGLTRARELRCPSAELPRFPTGELLRCSSGGTGPPGANATVIATNKTSQSRNARIHRRPRETTERASEDRPHLVHVPITDLAAAPYACPPKSLRSHRLPALVDYVENPLVVADGSHLDPTCFAESVPDSAVGELSTAADEVHLEAARHAVWIAKMVGHKLDKSLGVENPEEVADCDVNVREHDTFDHEDVAVRREAVARRGSAEPRHVRLAAEQS
ncbi:MAG: hypothetical protein BJ554DRAFT_4175 [Olpidium bornovanus]|uniref:Uncharacterized protein n=1 Tax=Olpidium bornovanus TaxID=278681 RepID=A0A8H7ZN45_9FUNG|nr:MAG: hypothetical protein BJ554DRAFT_4175 [Olpidium bornovanus]